MGLDLYSKIEQYLDFEDEVRALHKEFLNILVKIEPKSVIDIGCGQGAFLQHLEFNDIEAFGIDLSSEQIKICKEKGLKAKAIPLREVKENFDVATAIFDVVNYIEENALEEFFCSVSDILNDDGYFVFDVNTLYGFDEVAQGSLNLDFEDKFIAIDAVFEKNNLKTDITFFQKREDELYTKESDSIIQYFHTQEKLLEFIKKSGFKVEEIKNISLHNYEQNDKTIFICRKKI